jgi:hypothetical protein
MVSLLLQSSLAVDGQSRRRVALDRPTFGLHPLCRLRAGGMSGQAPVYGPFVLAPPLTSCEPAFLVFVRRVRLSLSRTIDISPCSWEQGQGTPPYSIAVAGTADAIFTALETLPTQSRAGVVEWHVDFNAGANLVRLQLLIIGAAARADQPDLRADFCPDRWRRTACLLALQGRPTGSRLDLSVRLSRHLGRPTSVDSRGLTCPSPYAAAASRKSLPLQTTQAPSQAASSAQSSSPSSSSPRSGTSAAPAAA